MNNEQAYRSKLLSDTQRQVLLDRLDREDSADARARERRKKTRLPYRRVGVPLEITHPGGSSTSCRVATRNLSETGVSFLYWGFLHIGTECRVELRNSNEERELLDGKVTWCKHVIGPHHVVGIKFNRDVVPKTFFGTEEWAHVEATHAAAPPAANAETKLSGRVLVVEEQDLDFELLTHFLRNSGVEIVRVTNAGSAAVELKKGSFDALLFTVCDEPALAEQTLATCRAAGFAGPAIVMTAETSPARLAGVQRAGISAIIHKPYTREKLVSLLANWLAEDEVTANAGPLHSTLADSRDMVPLIEKFVSQTRELAEALGKAINADDSSRVRGCCQTLLGTGSSIGFAPVSDAAMGAIKVLDAHGTIAQAALELKRLESLCRRATAGKPGDQPPAKPAKKKAPSGESRSAPKSEKKKPESK